MTESYTRLFLNTIIENVIVIDKKLTIIYQNHSNEILYGKRLGENCYSVFRGRNEPCADCLILDVFADGKPRRGLRDVVLPNGDIHWIELHSSALRDQDGHIIGAVEAIHDVTEQIRLTDECYIQCRFLKKHSTGKRL